MGEGARGDAPMAEHQQPLLPATNLEDEESPALQACDGQKAAVSSLMWQSAKAMVITALPLLLQYVSVYMISIINLAFIGHHSGKVALAASSLATSFVGVVARTVLMGLCGALDTKAAQAYGAGNYLAIGVHFRRMVFFLWAHALVITAVLLCAPRILVYAGEDPEMASMAFSYICLLLPYVWLDCVNRAMNSVLVAQGITQPQMWVSVVVVPLHVITNKIFIYHLGYGYLGAAIAMSLSAAYVLVLNSIWIAATGMTPRVWGTCSTWLIIWDTRSWLSLARLAYPACFMKCAESWGFSMLTIAAGMLPDPSTNVAAISVAFNVYGILYMGFCALSMTACAQVGNGLGAGCPKRARASALAACSVAPVMWLVVAVVLVEPHCQLALMHVFTSGDDAVLMEHMRRLFILVAVLEFFDGVQYVLTGIVQGAGKQKLGMLVNVVAFYVLAVPAALFLGFNMHRGVEGMYTGMVLGPATQLVLYMIVLLRLDWDAEAKIAARKAQQV